MGPTFQTSNPHKPEEGRAAADLGRVEEQCGDDGQQDQGTRLEVAMGHGSNARIDHRTELEEGQEPVPCSKEAHGGG